MLILPHGCQDTADLGLGPAHTVQRHPVVCLLLRFVKLHSQHIEHHHFRFFVGECLLQKIIRLPDHLLRTSSNIAVDPVLLPENCRRNIFIEFTVSDKDHVVILHLVIILLYHAPFHYIIHIFRHQQTL